MDYRQELELRATPPLGEIWGTTREAARAAFITGGLSGEGLLWLCMRRPRQLCGLLAVYTAQYCTSCECTSKCARALRCQRLLSLHCAGYCLAPGFHLWRDGRRAWWVDVAELEFGIARIGGFVYVPAAGAGVA